MAGVAAVLTLYGSICLLDNDVCPPPLPVVNGTNKTDSTDRGGVSDTGVGLLMVILGVVASLPVTLVCCIRRGRFDSWMFCGERPSGVDPPEGGSNGRSPMSRELLLEEEDSILEFTVHIHLSTLSAGDLAGSGRDNCAR